jgi:hypothetical protein
VIVPYSSTRRTNAVGEIYNSVISFQERRISFHVYLQGAVAFGKLQSLPKLLLYLCVMEPALLRSLDSVHQFNVAPLCFFAQAVRRPKAEVVAKLLADIERLWQQQ